MIKFRKYTDLPKDLLYPLFVTKFGSIVAFNCDFIPRFFMQWLIYNSVRPSPNLSPNLVRINIGIVFCWKFNTDKILHLLSVYIIFLYLFITIVKDCSFSITSRGRPLMLCQLISFTFNPFNLLWISHKILWYSLVTCRRSRIINKIMHFCRVLVIVQIKLCRRWSLN